MPQKDDNELGKKSIQATKDKINLLSKFTNFQYSQNKFNLLGKKKKKKKKFQVKEVN